MSLRGNIEHIVHCNGIEAALVRIEQQPDTFSDTFSGDDHWNRTLAKALDVFRLSDESSVRIVVGRHTLVVQRERDGQVAVALLTGHPMAKSLRRMLRRMGRKDRGPLVSPRNADAQQLSASPPHIERSPTRLGADDGPEIHALLSF